MLLSASFWFQSIFIFVMFIFEIFPSNLTQFKVLFLQWRCVVIRAGAVMTSERERQRKRRETDRQRETKRDRERQRDRQQFIVAPMYSRSEIFLSNWECVLAIWGCKLAAALLKVQMIFMQLF